MICALREYGGRGLGFGLKVGREGRFTEELKRYLEPKVPWYR